MKEKPAANKTLVPDVKLCKALGGIISPSFLRKDRLGAQLIPFYRFGKRCLYDVNEATAAIRRNRFGGKTA